MAGEWTEQRFGSLVRFISDKSQAKDASIDTYISTENMVGDFGGITPASALPLTGSVTKFKDGDTLFSNIRTYFKKVWQARFDGYCSNDVLVLRPANKEVLAPNYLHQICRWEKFTELSIRTSKGAKMPRGDKDALADFKFRLPPLPEQRAIAHILGALDDKIELNRRMSETLEEMARALFKSWFVDFDPVRAKAEGRDPGLPKPLADLFPDSFQDSELGEIPKGWEVGCVGDEFDLTMGQSPPGETYNETGEGLPFYQGRADFEARFPKRRVYCTAPTRLARKGDTLISVRAPVGDINMAGEDCAIGRGVAAARHKSGSRSYTYQFMLGLKEVFARFEAEGTVFGSISKKDFHAIPCVVPTPDIVTAFESMLAPLDDRVEVTWRESSTLTAQRDTLLPKLISGELRVKDAERFLKCRGES